MSQIVKAAVIALATLGTGTGTVALMTEDIPDLQVPEGAWSADGSLDGMVFEIYGTDVASGAVLEDDLLFRDGLFQSVDCQNYCDFGWAPYQTMVVDGVVHFTVTMVCPDAPHTVVFYGQVIDGAIVAEVTWTTRRWYWTNQIAMTVETVLEPPLAEGATVEG